MVSVVNTCSDIDECFLELDNCHVNATCHNNDGSYTCECKDNFEEDGIQNAIQLKNAILLVTYPI